MTETQPIIRPATEVDLEAINEIYNDEVLHRVASWDFEPWGIEQRRQWLAEHERDVTTPVFVAEVAGEVAGMSYLSWYRPRPGYTFTRENTVYIDARFQRQGIGALLLGALIEAGEASELRTLIAVIESSNEASIALHARFGFERAGLLREVGFKFDDWLDSVYMQLRLSVPREG
jgi:phosphinothricin acetyltransferase